MSENSGSLPDIAEWLISPAPSQYIESVSIDMMKVIVGDISAVSLFTNVLAFVTSVFAFSNFFP